MAQLHHLPRHEGDDCKVCQCDLRRCIGTPHQDSYRMIHTPMQFNRPLLTRLMAVALVVGCVGTSQIAWAGFQPKFKSGQKTYAGRRVGLATRGPACNVTSPPSLGLTAMVPANLLGVSASPSPTVSWFIPQNTYTTVEFNLSQSTGETLYSTTIQDPIQNQINSLSLSQEAGILPLVAGQDYQWEIKLVCAQDASGVKQPAIAAHGWITYEPPAAELTSQLAQATPEERYELYAANGYWYDAFQSVLALRQSGAESLGGKTQWEALLKHEAVKLGQFAPLPTLK